MSSENKTTNQRGRHASLLVQALMKLGHGRRARRRPVGSASPAGPEPGTGRLAPPSPDELGGGALRRRAPRRTPPAGAEEVSGAAVSLASRARDPSFRPFAIGSSASAATTDPDSSSEFRRLRVRVEAASQPRYSRRPLLPGEPGHGTPPSERGAARSRVVTSRASVSSFAADGTREGSALRASASRRPPSRLARLLCLILSCAAEQSTAASKALSLTPCRVICDPVLGSLHR